MSSDNGQDVQTGGGIVEGNQVPESGPSLDIEALATDYRKKCEACLEGIDQSSDAKIKEALAPIKQFMNGLLQVNDQLITHNKQLEKSGLRGMENMAMGLRDSEQQQPDATALQQLANDSSDDVKTLLDILKQLVIKSDEISLDDYTFHTFDRNEIEKTITEWKTLQDSIMPIKMENIKMANDYDLTTERTDFVDTDVENENFVNAGSQEALNFQYPCAECQKWNNILLKISCANKNSGESRSFKHYQKEIANLQEDLSRKDLELESVRDTLKTLEANFKDCKWALATEVAEKHDQIVELKRVVATLEEKLRQADMQTHFKDDIIKKIRNESKSGKSTETKRLYDVVTELTGQHKKMDTTSNGDVKFQNDVRASLVDIVNNIEETLKNVPLDVRRAEAERLTRIKCHLLHQPKQNVTHAKQEINIKGAESLQSILSDLDDMIAAIKHNQSIPDEKLQDLGKDIETVGSQLSLVKMYPSQEKAVFEIVRLVDEILSKLSVNVPETGNPSWEDLKNKIITLRDYLFDICLPTLKTQLSSEQEMVRNKEEAMQNLHTMVNLREQQVQNFTTRVVDLEKQLEEQRKVIAELQMAVQESKKLDAENDEICSLRFEVCEMDMKQKLYEKEIHKRYQALERCHGENQNLRRKLESVGEDLRDLKVEFKDCLQKNAHLENKNLHLEEALKSREKEILILQKQVQILEKEVESESERNEGRTYYDTKIIETLRGKVQHLEYELRRVQNDYTEMLEAAEVKYLATKSHADEQRNDLVIQNQDLTYTVRKLTYENQCLEKDAKEHLHNQEVTKSELKRHQRKNQENDEIIADLQKQVKTWEEKFVEMKEKFTLKLTKNEKNQQQFMKIIQDLSNNLEDGKRREAQFSNKIKETKETIEDLKIKNKQLKMRLTEKEEERQNEYFSELNELENAVGMMRKEIMRLKNKCNVLGEELEKQNNLRENLESQMTNHQLLINKTRDYENRLIPELAADLERHKNIVENLKIEIREANASCMQMRHEALLLIQKTDSDSKKQIDPRRTPEDPRLAIAVVSDSEKKKSFDPWSPKPPAAHSIWQRNNRLNDSSEYFVESGIQSMLQSPVPASSGYMNNYVD